MLSALMVSTSVSISACDLSCWLNQTPSDCHSANSTAEDRMSTSASSAMDMTPGMGMSSEGMQNKGGPDRRADRVMRHALSAHMDMTWGPRQVTSKDELSPHSGFTHSRALSPCSHETCSQVAASSSPPKTDENHAADLQCAVIRVSTPASLLTISNRSAPGDTLLINRSAAPLSPLRI